MQVNITELIENGIFGFIKIGDSKQDLLNNQLTPESWLRDYNIDNSPIWRYGNIDFHFTDSNILTSITNNYVTEINGGKPIQIIDRWIFKENNNPTLKEALDYLSLLGLDYKKETNNLNIINIELKNGVFFSFENLESEQDEAHYSNYKITVLGIKNVW